jgi:hypothetical protein
MPFFSRIFFAWVAYFRVLFDGEFAARVALVKDGMPALPEAATPPVPTSRVSAPPAEASHDAPAKTAKAATPARDASPDSAFLLLGALQREGRLLDFLQEDLTAASDADIGAAARVVHEGCSKALKKLLTLEPIRTEAEESRVEIESDFDASALKLTGNVTGSGPYRGTLRHAGWRVTKENLPSALPGHDTRVLAQAEVEL